MELILRLSSALPREIVREFFFTLHPPSLGDFLEACKNGKRLLIEQWLFLGLVDVSIEENNAICFAAEDGHPGVVSLLLDHGADPCATGTSSYLLICEPIHPPLDNAPLMMAVSEGHTEVVSILLDHGADVSTHDNNPICTAALNGYLHIVSLLLDHGADASARNNLPILSAAYDGHYKVVSLLLDHGADASARNNLAIIWAERNGHYDIVSLLLDHGGISLCTRE